MLRSAVSHRRVCVSVVVCFRCIVYHLETRMRKDVCFGVIALTWVMSAVLASPLAIFREYDSFTLEPGHTIQVLHTHTHTHTHTPVTLVQIRALTSLLIHLFDPRCLSHPSSCLSSLPPSSRPPLAPFIAHSVLSPPQPLHSEPSRQSKINTSFSNLFHVSLQYEHLPSFTPGTFAHTLTSFSSFLFFVLSS